MSKLTLSFLMDFDILGQHEISQMLFIPEVSKLISASVNGEMILWRVSDKLDKLEKKILLTPNLHFELGKLCCFTMLKKPILYLTVSSSFLLLIFLSLGGD